MHPSPLLLLACGHNTCFSRPRINVATQLGSMPCTCVIVIDCLTQGCPKSGLWAKSSPSTDLKGPLLGFTRKTQHNLFNLHRWTPQSDLSRTQTHINNRDLPFPVNDRNPPSATIATRRTRVDPRVS